MRGVGEWTRPGGFKDGRAVDRWIVWMRMHARVGHSVALVAVG